MKGQGLVAKVHYRGENTKEDFVIIVDSAEDVKKWRADKSIALTQVVNAFTVFTTDKHGAQGNLNTASQGTLENEFGTHNENDVVKAILEKGTIIESMSQDKQGSKNESNGARNAF